MYFYLIICVLFKKLSCFRLTVKDSDHASNSTTANITVLKVPDYPPVANAGQDMIIYLPHNSVTLNGSLSTDDKGIVSWEWTKAPSDQDKAVDMQVFHFVKLSYPLIANLDYHQSKQLICLRIRVSTIDMCIDY